MRSELRKVEDQLNALPPVVETAEEAVERAKTELFRLAEQFCSVELSNKEQLDQELELSKMPEMELNRLFKEHSKRFIQQVFCRSIMHQGHLSTAVTAFCDVAFSAQTCNHNLSVAQCCT